MVVFFDLDDTLIDHSAAMRSAAASLHTNLHLGGSTQDFIVAWQEAIDVYYPLYVTGVMTFETSRWARIRQTIDPGLADEEADRLFADYLVNYESAWTIFPDVLPCLDRLASVPLGIITNGQTGQQRSKLARFDLSRRFEHIFISEECGLRKPDREIFSAACNAAGVPPGDALHIGDSYEVDVCGARGAGLQGVWLDRQRSATASHRPPMMHSLEELISVTGPIA